VIRGKEAATQPSLRGRPLPRIWRIAGLGCVVPWWLLVESLESLARETCSTPSAVRVSSTGI